MELDPDIFRAYDIRGIVSEAITPQVVRTLCHAIGTLYPNSPRVAVGRDGRLSSSQLTEAVCQGLMAAGRTAIDVGEVPTPVLYYATQKLATGAGIMVTGSHNPPEYNGLKVMMDGRTLYGEDIQNIYRRVKEGELAQADGKRINQNLTQSYIYEICRDIQLARPLHIAIDCGNGVAGPLASKLFQNLDCMVTELYCEVDGNFPNHHPNPSNPENLKALIERLRADHLELGLAFDGDGDRVGVIDDQGNIIWADRLMMLYASDVLSRNPGAEIIFDVKSSRHLADMITQHGGAPRMWKTGHSFIKAKMKETGALLAGEMSGHIFFKERWYGFDDALYAAARLLEIIAKDERTSSQIFAALPDAVNTPELNVHFNKDGAQHSFMTAFKANADFGGGKVNEIDGVRVDFPRGWGLVRASNTTPSLVIRFEADDQAELQRIEELFRKQIRAVDSGLELPF